LPAVEPVLGGRARHGAMARRSRGEVVEARRLHAALALLGGRVAAAGADELARLPAAREVVLRRSRADGIALRVPVDLLPAPELLGVAVAGEDLDQRLPIGVVLRLRELLVERHTGRRVEAPGRAVRDHDRVEAPLRELLEELARRLGRLVAVVGE